jgi:galactokinase
MRHKYGARIVGPMSRFRPEPPDPEQLRARLRDVVSLADQRAIRVVRAPGRVNLIGEHTDYNDGWVMPMAIGLEIRVASAPRADRRVRMRIESGEVGELDLDDLGARRGAWIDYVAGVAVELQRRDVPLRGVDAVLAASLPAGAGLSSSAAFELAAGWTLAADVPPPVAPLELALACQAAENDYVGVRCGIMDQAAVALGRADRAVLLDCRSLEVEHVPIAVPGHRWVVIESGSQRALSDSAYNARRAECDAAVAAIRRGEPAVRSLRDVDPAMLERHTASLGAATLKRARHVVAENQRVLDAAAALRAGDLGAVGTLLDASHRSLRDLYEVSSAELDALVDVARSVDGVIGARLTGAGFGGSIVALVAEDALEALASALTTQYEGRTGLRATLHAVDAVDGAGLAG